MTRSQALRAEITEAVRGLDPDTVWALQVKIDQAEGTANARARAMRVKAVRKEIARLLPVVPAWYSLTLLYEILAEVVPF